MSGFAWVTLATNDSYSLGALVLAHSLRRVGTVHQLAVLVTPGVTAVMREKLASVFNVVREVNILDSRDQANLRLLQRPDLGITFTKLHCWRLTQFDKCVFLDADTLVLQNADELFEREEFSAAPDVGWPDCFNSGVFVYRPSEDTYGKLIQFALEKGSFDGGDQGLLNLYFSDWAHKDISKHLPFIYNMCSTACYSYLPAFKQFGGNVKIVHFIGNAKPWLQYFDTETRQVHVTPGLQHLSSVVQHWWDIFCSLVHPSLSPEMTRSNAAYYASFHSSIEPVPFPHFLSKHYDTFSENVVTDHTNSKNVWDPWDDYEKSQHEIPVVEFSQTEQLSCSQNYEDSANSQSFAQTELLSTESFPSHNTIEHDKNSDVKFLSESHINNSISNACNIEEPQQFRTDNNKTQEPEYFAHTQIEQESSNLKTSIESLTTVAHIPSECNQLAWPHECEPASCVTNENALHANPNEVHDGSAGLAGAFAQLTLGVPRTAEQSSLEDHLRRQGWEVGNIDYMGRDSFDNIWSKICETLSNGSTVSGAAPPEPAPPTPIASAEATGSSPPAVPVQPQQVPEPAKASDIDSAAKECPVKTAEPVVQEVKSAALPTEASKPEASYPKQPSAEPSSILATAAIPSETKPQESESPKPVTPVAAPEAKTPSQSSQPAQPAEVATAPVQTPPSSPAPKPEAAAPIPQQTPPSPPAPKAEAAAPKPPQQTPPSSPAPKAEAAAPKPPQQTPPSSPAPKAEAAAPKPPQQTPPSSPAPKAETAAPKPSQQTTPSSPAPKAEAAVPKPPQQTPPSSPAPKAEAAAPKLTQQTPPSSPSPKTEAAVGKAQQTPPSSPSPKTEAAALKLQAPVSKTQAKAAPPKEAAAASPETPPSPQTKAAPTKKTTAVESAAAEKSSEEASGGQGPTPPPRKTGGGSGGGGGGTKKTGKGKK